MKKGQVLEATVERVDFPNKGIARAGEETVIVKNSLPGQRIKLSVNKVRNGKAEGRLMEVMKPSPLETGSPCSLFGICGGCTYLSLPYEEQLKIKEAQVKRLLDTCLSSQEHSWQWEGIKGSPVVCEYRNKMEFTFGDQVKNGPLTLGMHRRGSFYDVVSAEGCRIVDEDYRLIVQTAQAYFAEIPYYHRLRHEGYLRHLVVRKAARTGEILAALVTTSQNSTYQGADTELTDGFSDRLLELEHSGRLKGHFAGILHIINDSQADIVQSDQMHIHYGRDWFYEELLGLRFRISVFSFFQTNTLAAEILYKTVREYACDSDGNCGDGKVIFDLYCGTGTIAQMMSPMAESVIGVEIVEEAVLAAQRNAGENGLHNCEFIAGDVLKVLDTIDRKPDLIILDPPREGIHPKALPKIIAYGVDKIVYISCKPTSMVKDLAIFLDSGYTVEKAVAIDQFPWTANIETCVLLSRK